MINKQWNVAVIGAAGTVGSQMIECLEEREFPVGAIKCLGSDGNGEILEFRGKPAPLERVTRDSFAGIDIAIFAGGEELSREFCPAAAAAGAICIDCSPAWRMDPDVPLVVPEVNPQAVAGYAKKGIIAAPGCAAIMLTVALNPLHEAAAIGRIVVSTYQAVSDSGAQGIDELRKQVGSLLNGRPVTCNVYSHQIAFNCLPQIGSVGEGGSTGEEMGLVSETRKVMGGDVRVTATTVLVPVFYGNSESVNIETAKKLTVDQARKLLKKAPGVKLVDDPVKGAYPMPFTAAGQDLVCVGRIREDGSVGNGLNLWVTADNLRKGAAVNAVQIAEILVQSYLK